MKICVYAIAKNEEKFADRFMDASAEADWVCVLDTGSEDGTVRRLEERGAIVRQEAIDPWRFDEARNRSMELIPPDADIAVSVDLDEVLSPGWRGKLEAAWKDGTELARVTCVTSRNGDGSPGTSFLIGKAHRPGVFRWKYPVHEVLVRADGKPDSNTVDAPEVVKEHLPDKAKSRGQYLPLLELAAEENPQDPRCAHYLGREYMYYRRWEDAIRELERYLLLPGATWAEERAATMRYLAECCLWSGRKKLALRWATRAMAEAIDQRENWYEVEKVSYYLGKWDGVVFAGGQCLVRTERSSTCINDAEAWGAAPWDLLSIGLWHTGDTVGAVNAARRAAELEPDNERIGKNLLFFCKEAVGDPAGIQRSDSSGERRSEEAGENLAVRRGQSPADFAAAP